MQSGGAIPAELARKYPNTPDAVLRSLMVVDEQLINYDLIEDLIYYIRSTSPQTGAILIFLPGLMEITTLYERLVGDKEEGGFGDVNEYLVFPLHSQLSTSEQRGIFEPPREGVRKIVISTNIAETSITIEDCVFVIDAGRVKENRYDNVNKMATLQEVWVSQASAKQRRGRAGRVRDGYCYHLFSSGTHDDELDEYTLPEMLRVPLDETILQIKLLNLCEGRADTFLGNAVNPPPAAAITNAMESLRDLQALDSAHNDVLTTLGYHLATLPVEPRIGKMLCFGAIFNCLDPVLTIAASMSARNPFMAPLDKRELADEAKRKLAPETMSDHMTLLAAYQGWEDAHRDASRSPWKFVHDNFLSNNSLTMIRDLRVQVRERMDVNE